MRPFEEFIERALREFEQFLKRERLTQSAREQRLHGARDFAVFLLGRPIGEGAGPRRAR